MNDTKWFPDGGQLATTYLTVTKVKDAIEYYQKAFGFEPGESMPGPSGDLVHASMKYMDTHLIMFGPEGLPWVKTESPVSSGSKCPTSIYLYSPDVDATVKSAIDAGGKVVKEAEDMFWGDRIATISDPFGYEWILATKVGEFDMEKMKDYDPSK